MLGALMSTALVFGTAASVDAFYSNVKTPSDRIAAVSGQSVELAGTLEDASIDSPLALRIVVSPATDRIVVNGTRFEPRRFSEGVAWRTTLTLMPQLPSGLYGVSVSVTGNSTVHLPTPKIDLDVFPSEEALDAASPSFLMRHAGLNPLSTAVRTLLFALLAGFSWWTLRFYTRAQLRQRGYLRIYHAKPDGDDTLLYCLDSDRRVEAGEPYPVLTAAGQTLGTAFLLERESRYCVLKLTSARARVREPHNPGEPCQTHERKKGVLSGSLLFCRSSFYFSSLSCRRLSASWQGRSLAAPTDRTQCFCCARRQAATASEHSAIRAGPL